MYKKHIALSLRIYIYIYIRTYIYAYVMYNELRLHTYVGSLATYVCSHNM